MPDTRKICSLDRLLALRRQAREQGKTVVHCHGCFDIVHPGHVHHLQFAKSLGDILIVTVSADPQVNKGVNRPLIPEDLRAANLAALECVDWVYINPYPTAVELLDQLRPDIYVKGREHESNPDPRFLAERDIVARHGGRCVFSSGDIVFSSTALINHLEDHDPFEQEKLRRLRQRHDLTDANLHDLAGRFRGLRAVVIGDYILDRYHFCDAAGIAGESPMMVLRNLSTREYDGGASVIALHLAGLGAVPALVTAFADDELANQARERLGHCGLEIHSVATRRQTVTKTRYLADQSKLFRFDEGAASPLDSQTQQAVAQSILAAADGASAVIFADFGYGLITGALLDQIMPELRRKVPIITADVSGRQSNLLRFRGADLLCPTEREARETLHDFGSGLGALAWNLLHAADARQAILTMGKQGLITFARTDPDPTARLASEHIPALSAQAIDPMGSGDALLATASLALAAGGSFPAAAFLGAVAAAVEAQLLGNVPPTADRLLAHLQHLGCAPPAAPVEFNAQRSALSTAA